VHNKELCIMYGDKKYGQNFGWKAWREETIGTRSKWDDHIKWILRTQNGSVDWTDPAEGLEQWQALVNMVMNLSVQ
jgi:hypothetical protein